MKSNRAVNAIHNARPIVRTVLTTTAIAWSLGIQLPQPAPRPTVLAQALVLGAVNSAAATQASPRLLSRSFEAGPLRPAQAGASRPA